MREPARSGSSGRSPWLALISIGVAVSLFSLIQAELSFPVATTFSLSLRQWTALAAIAMLVVAWHIREPIGARHVTRWDGAALFALISMTAHGVQ